MVSQDSRSLSLTREELCLLAGLLGIASLPGPDDPFFGLLAEEVDEHLEAARTSLAEQGLLAVQGDGSVSLDAIAAALVGALGAARHTLVARRGEGEAEAQVCLLHRAEGLFVQQILYANGQVVLTAVRDLVVLAGRLRGFCGLPPAPAAPGPAFALSGAELMAARHLATEKGEAACLSRLAQMGVPAEARPALAAALAVPAALGSLVALERDGAGAAYSEGLAWLAGERGAWRLQAVEQGVRLLPSAAAEIERQLAEAVRRFRGGEG